MATIALPQQLFQNIFGRQQTGPKIKCIDFNHATGECEKEEVGHENVILQKAKWERVTNYLLHASYEGLKQNLNGADINIDYLLLTIRVYGAIGFDLAAQPVKAVSHTVNKIISSLNRHHNQSALN